VLAAALGIVAWMRMRPPGTDPTIWKATAPAAGHADKTTPGTPPHAGPTGAAAGLTIDRAQSATIPAPGEPAATAAKPTTAKPTTVKPTTAKPTTAKPTTAHRVSDKNHLPAPAPAPAPPTAAAVGDTAAPAMPIVPAPVSPAANPQAKPRPLLIEKLQ
jgi:hypothetical protein